MRAQAFSASLALLLLATGPLAAFAEPTQPHQADSSWKSTVELKYHDVEGGILNFINSLHANHPLVNSVHMDSNITAAANMVKDPTPTNTSDPVQFLTNSMSSRRLLHDEWRGGLRGGRRLAQAPTGVNVLTAVVPDCKSVVCGGQCCDAFFTYSSNANTTCTQPNPTCSASDTCTYSSNNDTQCPGLNYGFHPFPDDSSADNPSNQVGYACPSGADSSCSYLNSFSADLSACTVGACIPTTSGGLSCVPIIKGIGNYGCAAAIQTFTGGTQITAAVNTNTNAVAAQAGATAGFAGK
jgi:hypothetical protein